MEAAGGRYGKHTGQVRVGCEAASAQSRLTNEPMTFTSEQTLVDTFVGLLETNRSPWGEVRLAREFDYSRGRTDVVAVADADTLIAVEAKLTDWKYALHQAYRNTCFAHRSFVLLPKEAAIAAGVFLVEFERRGVGLCYIDSAANLVVPCDSPRASPVEPWLASEAISRVRRLSDATCQPLPTPWNQ